MKEVKVYENNVLAAHNKANADTKATLENLFGKDLFSRKITDRVKSFEDACMVMGKYPRDYDLPSNANGDDNIRCNLAHRKFIEVIVPALNEGWFPNYKNSSERKWYPWFEYNTAGFGFANSYYHCVNTRTTVGSRLVFKTEELASHAGKTFIKEYNDLLL